ncbi:ribonuclease H-like domain-containing protein [Tanacetum coccineum]
MRLESRALALPVDSSSPMVLMAESGNNRRSSSTPQAKSWRPCFNFAKGTCRFGEMCRYVHDATVKSSNSNKPRGSNDVGANTNDLLAKLIEQLRGLNVTNTRTNNTSKHTDHSTATVNSGQSSSTFLLGPTTPPGQATTLPAAFTTGTLHDPTTGAWNMDTCASSHLNNNVTSLSENFNMCMYPFISVGDGRSILVTNTGHSILSSSVRNLHLNNVLITPYIVKILISLRQFVRDNNCTIEFDEFGFSVKDYMTRQVLL